MLDSKLRCNEFEKINRGQSHGVQDQSRIRLRRNLAESCPKQGGFSGSHFTGEEQESLAARDAVHERGEPFLVGLTQPQKTRIRCQREGLFSESKESFVHR